MIAARLSHRCKVARSVTLIVLDRLREAGVLTLCVFALIPFIIGSATLADDSFPKPFDTQAETEKPLTPQEALAAFHVPEGFKATLFAAEPDVCNPISICTDSRGRLWVAENYTYAESGTNYDLRLHDRVIVLEDTDGDGVHDKRTVFYDKIQKLTSVAVGMGGVWITCAPMTTPDGPRPKLELLFIPDANADAVPDGEPVVMLDGFDGDAIRHNIVNGLKWGPDGWLYGRHGIMATSFVGRPGAADSERRAINCGVWRFHPTRHLFEVVSQGTTNPWGMDWDSNGECWLINTVIGHLWHVLPNAHWRRMYGSHFNPHIYEVMEQTADHFHWATGENWGDVKKGMSATTDAAGGGHAHCGILYCDATWPAEFRGSVLAGNYHGRRLNRDILVRKGCGYTATHAPDFISSSDPYFKVIELEHARDGGMFVADWSDIGECHDNDGVHRSSGRIFKVTWDTEPHQTSSSPKLPDVDGAGNASNGGIERAALFEEEAIFPLNRTVDIASLTSDQLLLLQGHRSEWYARRARLILQERAARGDAMLPVADACRNLVQSASSPVHKLRLFWCLLVTGQLKHSDLQLAVQDNDEHLNAWGVRMIAEHPELLADPATAAEWLGDIAATTKSGLVRLYIAATITRFSLPDRLHLATILAAQEQDAHDPQLPLLLWVGVEPAIAADPARGVALMAESKLPQLSRFIARRLTGESSTDMTGINAIAAILKGSTNEHNGLRRQVLLGMNDALRGWRKAPQPAQWNDVVNQMQTSGDGDLVTMTRDLSLLFGDGRAIEEVRKIALDGRAELSTRQAAIRSLVESRADGLAPMLEELLKNRDLAAPAIEGLAAVGGPETPQLLAANYNRYRQDGKTAAITTLVSRPDFAPRLIEAVEQGKIPREDVPSFQLRQMLTYGNAELATRINQQWPELARLSTEKQTRMAEFRKALTADTLAAGDRSAGRKLFQESCAKCHKLFGEGGTTAPDITGAQRSNLNYLLENIVDPSATVSKNYKMSIVILDDGRVLNGIVLENRADSPTISLQLPDQLVRLDRSSIEQLRETEMSLMPEGQLDRLTPEQLRNLMSYLMSPSQVE
ncbi:MAG: c-type cytochrome [Planctomycetaceae bacterium]